jgi:hypothetical protein
VSTFPEFWLNPGTPLFRMHRDGNGPSYFGNSGAMRFDPPPTHLNVFGTCYVAETDVACALEVLGDLRPIPQHEIDIRRITEFEVVRPLRLANLLDRTVAGKFRIDGTFSVGKVGLLFDPAATAVADLVPERELTKQLAAELFDDRYDGILYKARHDPALVLTAYALFAPPGEQVAMFTPPKTTDLSDDLVRRLEDEFGYEIL